MNTRPSYGPGALHPVELGPFTEHQHRIDVRESKWRRNLVPLPARFDARALVQPTAVAAIRKAFTLSKTSHDAWKPVQREGRFDIRQAPRVSRGAQDVFKRKAGQSTTRVKVSVLIDASGSMRGRGSSTMQHPVDPTKIISVTRQMAAAVFGATIAVALGRIPTVDLDVFQHAASAETLHLKWLWHRGTPVGVFNEAAGGSIGGGGNADGHALVAVATRMQREIKRGERGIIMVVSDGLPSVTGDGIDSTPGTALQDAVAHARKLGIDVIAVAIDGSDQSAYYGAANVVPFTNGQWGALGSALARRVGHALAVR